MKYVYFTKLLKDLDLSGLIQFARDTGLDGFDLAVRPGYPVNPDNVATELPRAAKQFKDAGLTIGLVTAPTDMSNPDAKSAAALFEACGKSGVPAIKVGYLPYKSKFDDDLKQARTSLTGFAKLAEKTSVRACYHTHSGNYMGSNAGTLRLLLNDLDPHHVGAFMDTGHLALGGEPIRMALDIVRSWLTLIAIKDISWEKTASGWHSEVIPAGGGIVQWKDFAKAIKDVNFNGTISLHGEYETKSFDDRKKAAKEELAMLKKLLS